MGNEKKTQEAAQTAEKIAQLIEKHPALVAAIVVALKAQKGGAA